MKNLNGKKIGENLGIFMVCLISVMLLTPVLKAIAHIGLMVTQCN